MSRLMTASAVLLAAPLMTQAAGFGIDATRLIYPQSASSISVSVRNTETSTPYLVKASVGQSTSDATSSAFDLTPPLLRLDPGSTSQIRILARNVSNLPKDRESVFYFHASAIPASQANNGEGQSDAAQGAVHFGVGSIIKIFYRPNGLPGTSAAAQQNLKFSRTGTGLQVHNPSPYYVSFGSVSVGGKKLVLKKAQEKMIAPFATQTLTASHVQGTVQWTTINDGGGTHAFSQKLP